MKKMTFALLLFVGLSVMAPGNVSAKDVTDDAPVEAPAKEGKKAKKAKPRKAKPGAVAKALKKLKTFNGKVNDKALVYVYLQSASWCGFCVKEMPNVVETYKEMKKDGRAEIVLVGWDYTDDKAKAFLKQYKAKFPGTMKTAKNIDKLPGLTIAQGIPNAIMVDAEGNVLSKGSPSSVLSSWKDRADQAEAARDAAEPAEESGQES